MSDFKVEVVKIGIINRHPNADTLGVTEVVGAPVIIKLSEFQEGELVVYIPVDAIVPDLPQYKFLAPKDHIPGDPIPEKYRRIKAKKLRGVFSMGMLVKMPDLKGICLPVGYDAAATMQITKWEPNEEAASGPKIMEPRKDRRPWYRKWVSPAYWKRLIFVLLHKSEFGSKQIEGPINFSRYTNIEALRRHSNLLEEGEEVVITEKIHGANGRFGWSDGKFWVGSHSHFLSEPGIKTPRNWWWKVAYDGLQAKLKLAPEIGFYGEVYGTGIQKGFTYDGAKVLKVRFFDAKNLKTGMYLSYDEFVTLCDDLGLERVPELYRGPWSKDLKSMAEGKTMLGDHIIEGFVVKPVIEQMNFGLGRVILKCVGQGYLLERAKQ